MTIPPLERRPSRFFTLFCSPYATIDWMAAVDTIMVMIQIKKDRVVGLVCQVCLYFIQGNDLWDALARDFMDNGVNDDFPWPML